MSINQTIDTFLNTKKQRSGGEGDTIRKEMVQEEGEKVAVEMAVENLRKTRETCSCIPTSAVGFTNLDFLFITYSQVQCKRFDKSTSY